MSRVTGNSKTDNNKVVGFLEERMRLSSINYEIPASANTYGYALGAMSLFVLVLLGLTGAILGLFYTPTAEMASESVKAISTDPILQLIRSLHWWSAMSLPILMLLHVTRIVVTGAYKKPRELNWYVGVILYTVITLGSLYTGTMLAWDQAGFEALEHGIEIFAQLGFNGLEASELLPAIFFVHVSILPLFIFLLIFVHALLIRLLKISEPLNAEDDTETSTFFAHMKKVALYWAILFVVLLGISLVFPREAQPAPIRGVELTTPPWIYLPMFPVENIFGIISVLFVLWIPIVLLAIIPLIDRDSNRNLFQNRKQLLVASLVVLFVLSILVLDLAAVLMPASEHLASV